MKAKAQKPAKTQTVHSFARVGMRACNMNGTGAQATIVAILPGCAVLELDGNDKPKFEATEYKDLALFGCAPDPSAIGRPLSRKSA